VAERVHGTHGWHNVGAESEQRRHARTEVEQVVLRSRLMASSKAQAWTAQRALLLLRLLQMQVQLQVQRVRVQTVGGAAPAHVLSLVVMTARLVWQVLWD
jgi:hypothetical protein